MNMATTAMGGRTRIVLIGPTGGSRIQRTYRPSPRLFFPQRRSTVTINNKTTSWSSSSSRAGSSRTRLSSSSSSSASFSRRVWNEIRNRPVEYMSIPCVAAFVGIVTNYMGVQMLFYPIEYWSFIDLYTLTNGSISQLERPTECPYGYIGWQGVVPTKTKRMANRLVTIITQRLLSIRDAFARIEPSELASYLVEPVLDSVRKDCGEQYVIVLRPILPMLLTHIISQLQHEIEDVLDVRDMVLSAFIRDKLVLVELFQKVGRIELQFLVESGFVFGFVLGISQMIAWAIAPRYWTLPVAGALVGYITNWIAVKLLFEPAEPTKVGPFTIQGMFESRQVEVSDEFATFLECRVLSSSRILSALAKDGEDGELYKFLRRQLPYPIPSNILLAAVSAIERTGVEQNLHPALHAYVRDRLDVQQTLSSRLKTLSATEFEDLLHPVFQEDEITLIATGGVLGAAAGIAQTRLGWGGPNAIRDALVTIVLTLASSGFFFLNRIIDKTTTTTTTSSLSNEADEDDDKDLKDDGIRPRTELRRRNTILRVQ